MACDGFTRSSLASTASKIAEEKLGVVWDPEEPELPERLEFSKAGLAIIDPSVHGGNEVVCVVAACYRDTQGSKESLRVAIEAVRR